MRMLVIAAAVCASGCGGAPVGVPLFWSRADGAGQTALLRASVELPCEDWDRLTVTSLSGGGYRVEGCGLTATYTCARGYRSRTATCQRDGEIRSTAVVTVAAPAPVRIARPTTFAETSLRRAVDANRDAILVCTSHHAVAVRIAWSTDGLTVVSLDGPPHATPTEGCVRDVLDGLRAPPSDHGGTLLQAVTP
jgi:hypothetical protein